ncbi:MAG: HDOD domain-containing protein [Proteobacteria bacterium]|nr:HDOD domain-containing protein [Pseudomonadota bacterium]
MPEKSVIQLIDEYLNRDEIELPVFNHVAQNLQTIMARDDYSLAEMSEVIEKDQALTSHVLKAANSAFYAGLQPAKTIRDASVRLGAKSIVNLVTMVTQKRLYQSKVKPFVPLIGGLWTHALGVSTASRWLCQHMGFQNVSEESFLAGLLHDIGKLLILRAVEDLLKTEPGLKGVSMNLVNEIIDALHAEHGERLMRRLNIPEVYCTVAGKHHDPDIKGDNIVLNMVRLANLTCHKLGIGPKKNEEIMLSTTPEAINLMAKDILLAELQVDLEDQIAAMQV